MKSQSQRDLERHWADQSKKLTPTERLAAKAEKLRKQIERDKAFLERRKQQSGDPALQPASAAAVSKNQEAKPASPKPTASARRRAKE